MAIIRADKVAGIHLESVVATEELKNGNFVELGALVAGEKELRNAGRVTDLKNEVVLVSAPEVDPDPRKAGLKNFAIPANVPARAYHLTVGDIWTLTDDLFSTVPAVGDEVAPVVGSLKLDVKDPLVEARVVAEVIEQTVLGFENQRAFAIQIKSV